MFDGDPVVRNLNAEIERLRAAQRTLWMIVAASPDGCFTLEHHDVEDYPGDDRAMLDHSTDPVTGDMMFVAHVHQQTEGQK